jgi:hypothetical protein
VTQLQLTSSNQILYQQMADKIHGRMQSLKGAAAVKAFLKSIIAAVDSLDDVSGGEGQPTKKRKVESVSAHAPVVR